jgi:hypothetical protein
MTKITVKYFIQYRNIKCESMFLRLLLFNKKIMLETKDVCQNTLPCLIHLLQEQIQRQMAANTIISLGFTNLENLNARHI